MDVFLPSRAFPGPALAVDAYRGGLVGQATFDGAIAVFTRPRDEIAKRRPHRRLRSEGNALAGELAAAPSLVNPGCREGNS